MEKLHANFKSYPLSSVQTFLDFSTASTFIFCPALIRIFPGCVHASPFFLN